ncbi:MAG: hypothetical protein K6F68_06240 [Clostridiales bacterium]|nr:hypothetical protein [Clostridiales bacterium]
MKRIIIIFFGLLLLTSMACCRAVPINNAGITPMPSGTPSVSPAGTQKITDQTTPIATALPSVDPLYSTGTGVLYTVPAGDGENDVGYAAYDDGNAGPEAFIVMGDTVFVLDTVKARILILSGSVTGSVPLTGTVRPFHFCYADGRFYVVDYFSKTITVYEDGSESHDELPLPERLTGADVSQIFFDGTGNSLVIYDHGLFRYSYSLTAEEWTADGRILVDQSGSVKRITVNAAEYLLDTGEETTVRFLRQCMNGDIIVGVYEYETVDELVSVRYSVREYRPDGALLKCAYLDVSNSFSHPTDSVFIGYDDTVYTMICTADGAVIGTPIY